MGLNWTIKGGSVVTYQNTNTGAPTTITIAASADNARPSNAAYVAMWGNDTTGNGSRLRPYRTIAVAQAVSSFLIYASGYVSRENFNYNVTHCGDGWVVFLGASGNNFRATNIQFLNYSGYAGTGNPYIYNCTFINGSSHNNTIWNSIITSVGNDFYNNSTFSDCGNYNTFVNYGNTTVNMRNIRTLGLYNIFYGGSAGITINCIGNGSGNAFISNTSASYTSLNCDYNLFFNCNFNFINGVALSGTITNGSNIITGFSSTSSFAVGAPITGTGITNAIIVAILSPTSIQISVNASASSTNTYTSGFGQKNFSVVNTGTTTNGSNVITGFPIANLCIGNTISGTGIPSGATITEFLTFNSFRISVNATANGTVSLTSSLTTAGLRWFHNSCYPTSPAGLLNCVIADPLFNDLTNFDFTLSSSSPAKNMSNTGDFIGARGVAIRLKFRASEASGDWKNSVATNATIADNSLRMTSNAANTVIESNVISFGANNGLGRLNLDHFAADRNGDVIAVDSDLSTSGISAGTNVLTVDTPYQVIGGNITWNGQPITNANCFTAVAGQLSFTVASGSPQCFAIQQYPALRAVEMRGSNVSSADVASQTYYKYKIGIPITVNRVGNVSGGAISRGNGDPNFDQTPANVFTYNPSWGQFRVTVQWNDLNN